MLRLAWDAENDEHITRRHGISREEVREAVNSETMIRGREIRSGELRTVMIGRTDAGKVLVIVLTDVGPGVVRAATAFPAKRKLRSLYRNYLGGMQ